ncbi:hypothetical protein TRAPUB_5359 [Trametes pubescens]|uniref:Uncharacterized protein n=1 Tax=Trametes pubescens TaxID=154538 RepID=A0A1M2V8L2_TRAPU|nr:hypothetical protein TRAPUB_5359 [Trametes pubescens]
MPRNSGSSGEPALVSPALLLMLREREDMDASAAPSSRAFVSWRASRKRLFRIEEMLLRK